MDRSQKLTPPSPEDIRDWEALLQGREEAMTSIQERHGRVLLVHVKKLLRLHSLPLDAEDLVQNLFLVTWRTVRLVRQLDEAVQDPVRLESLRVAFVEAGARSSGKRGETRSQAGSPSRLLPESGSRGTPLDSPAAVEHTALADSEGLDDDDEGEDESGVVGDGGQPSDELVRWLRRLKLTRPYRGHHPPPNEGQWCALVQEVLQSKRGAMHLRGWLFEAADTRVLDGVRKLNSGQLNSLSEGYDPPAPDKPDPLELAESLEILQHCLSRLGSQERQVVQMRLQGLGNNQIASELGIPEGTVASAFSRAKDKLTECATARMGGK